MFAAKPGKKIALRIVREALIGDRGYGLGANVRTETEVAGVAGVAAIRADVKNAVEKVLHGSSSSRSVDIGIAAMGAVWWLRVEKCELHSVPSLEFQTSGTTAVCPV